VLILRSFGVQTTVPQSGAGRTIHVVLPAFNEADNISSVLGALDRTASEAGLLMRAIVVNDGSKDRTAEVTKSFAGAMPVFLIEHPANLGLGATIRTGLLRAAHDAAPGDIVVTMDADDTHTPQSIARMVELIDSGHDVVIASRYRPGARVTGVPISRRVMSRAASILFQAVHPVPGVRDFTCGYRAYRAEVLRAAVNRYREEFINQEGFQCMVDILLKLSRMRLRFCEVPLVLRYDRKSGKSKMKVGRTAAATLLLLVRRRMGL
jgi:dolichol-phosphate mannosyltransferase